MKFGKGDKSFDQEVIYKFLKFLMDLWATDLNDRSLEVKRGIEVLSPERGMEINSACLLK